MSLLTQSTHPPDATTEFALAYLKALGARVEHPEPGIIRAELSRDQVCELENRPLGTWYTMQSIPDWTTLYLGIQDPTQPVDRQDDRIEHIGLHALRLRQMLASAWRIGHLSRLRIVPRHTEKSEFYRPIALFGFEIGRCCSLRVTRSCPMAVDLVDGSASRTLAEALLTLPLDEQRVPRSQRRRRELRYQHAFDIACEAIKQALVEDPALWRWYHQAIDRFYTELDQVNQYFATRATEGPNKDENLEQLQKQAIAEVYRRFQPRIQLRARLGLLLYCPETELRRIE